MFENWAANMAACAFAVASVEVVASARTVANDVDAGSVVAPASVLIVKLRQSVRFAG